jgi:hypothetical protein
LEINKELTAELAKAKQHDLTTAVIAKDIDLANENAALKADVVKLNGMCDDLCADRDKWRELSGKLAEAIENFLDTDDGQTLYILAEYSRAVGEK